MAIPRVSARLVALIDNVLTGTRHFEKTRLPRRSTCPCRSNASGADSLAPNGRQPGLPFARQAGRAIVVRKLDKSRLGHVAPPGVQTVKRTEAPAIPLFLVVAARVRAEQDALRFER